MRNIQPVITQPIQNVSVLPNTPGTNLNISQNFDDTFTTGQVARFELFDTSLGGGVTNVLLFDQTGDGAPSTVQNFLNYVNDGDYVNSIIHRSIPDFIVQGGGFTVENLIVDPVPTDPPVANEFDSDRTNVRGTIAMAKLPGDPDSATNQWFFNVEDNSASLDNQNGGFTVFGQALSETDLAPVDAINALPTIDATPANPAFTDLPVIADDPNNPSVNDDQDLVRYRSITVSQTNELNFEVVSNSNPGLVTTALNNGQLQLAYTPNQTGTAEITIRATDLLGDSREDTFVVTVGNIIPGINLPGTPNNDFFNGTAGNDTINGGAGNDQLSGLSGDDEILGGQNNDSIFGGQNDDILRGGSGSDLLRGGKNNDFLRGDNDNDILFGDLGNDELRGNQGNDTLRGGQQNDILLGDNGNDNLFGDRDNDNLSGGNGEDTLTGGIGQDTLTGGTGQDSFSFTSSNEGIDQIADFSVVDDTIAVSATGFGGGLVANATITEEQFIIGTAATTTSHRFIYDNNSGNLFFDEDGTGTLAAVQIATLDGRLDMNNEDIFVTA